MALGGMTFCTMIFDRMAFGTSHYGRITFVRIAFGKMTFGKMTFCTWNYGTMIITLTFVRVTFSRMTFKKNYICQNDICHTASRQNDTILTVHRMALDIMALVLLPFGWMMFCLTPFVRMSFRTMTLGTMPLGRITLALIFGRITFHKKTFVWLPFGRTILTKSHRTQKQNLLPLHQMSLSSCRSRMAKDGLGMLCCICSWAASLHRPSCFLFLVPMIRKAATETRFMTCNHIVKQHLSDSNSTIIHKLFAMHQMSLSGCSSRMVKAGLGTLCCICSWAAGLYRPSCFLFLLWMVKKATTETRIMTFRQCY